MLTRICLLGMYMGIAFSLQAQSTPFSRGINLTNWFQAESAQQIQFTKYTRIDFEQIKQLGCDVIRLPINLHFMTQGAPDYVLDPLFLRYLDSAVNWAEALDLHLILDNHTFDPAANTLPSVEGVLVKVWPQMAAHFNNRSAKLYYEVLNEPHGIAAATWGAIQGRVIDSIRKVDQTHTIIVGPADWNSYHALAQLPFYPDTNLIYTFHFYDPFLFTHQGASWVAPSMEPVQNIPFPYEAGRMPSVPGNLGGTWVGNSYQSYPAEGTTQRMSQLIQVAVDFQEARKVPVFCGEFGVYQPNSLAADRIRWYEAMYDLLETHQIGWTMWDYHGGFGLFEAGGNDLFDHDLNVALLAALNFNVPPQSPFVLSPDTAGFFVYRDFIEAKIQDGSYTDGALSFVAANQAAYQENHISWSGANQYQAINFDFRPNKDLSTLVSNDFAVDFFIRSSVMAEGDALDVRFMDTKTQDTGDRPWRMVYRVSPGMSDQIGWKHVHIPLKDFAETGSWDNNQWYDPRGLFDWQAVDRLEFVSEQGGLVGTLDLDHIQVTDRDTARIAGATSVIGMQEPLAIVYPNPFVSSLTIKAVSPHNYEVVLMDRMGREIRRSSFWESVTWELDKLTTGIYLVQVFQAARLQGQYKVWKR